jgi:tRNA(Ile)-lysidine synthase
LHHIDRGTGLRGLAGMPRSRRLGDATLIRPLLGVGRAELRAYLGELRQPFRDDPSNAELCFTRNRIRRELLPELRAHFNPHADGAILRLGRLAAEAQAVIDGLVEQWFGRCVRFDPGGPARIETALLADQPRALLRELLISVWRQAGWSMQSMGLPQWEQLADALQSENGVPAGVSRAWPRQFPGGVRVEVAGGVMTLRPPTC